jgi:hypothetical protein
MDTKGHYSLDGDEQAGSCPCLSWTEVYQTKGVTCGQKFEGGGQEMCTTFYEKIKDPICLNKQLGGIEQWCYVSADCLSLVSGEDHGGNPLGGPMNEKVGWKTCSEETDDMTRKMTVEELMSWAEKNDLMPSLLVKQAYPVFPGTTWEQVKEPLTDGDLSRLDPTVREHYEFVQKRGVPVVFDSGDHHPPHGIMEGQKLFQSEQNWPYINAKRAAVWEHPYQIQKVTLIKGQ